MVNLCQHKKSSSLLCTRWDISDHGEENEYYPLLCLGKPTFLKIFSNLVCCSVKKENIPLIDREIQSKLLAPKIPTCVEILPLFESNEMSCIIIVVFCIVFFFSFFWSLFYFLYFFFDVFIFNFYFLYGYMHLFYIFYNKKKLYMLFQR